jgi:Na+/melibiose symporter-like transporter
LNTRRLCLYLAGQVGLMMMVRFLLQWIIRFATSTPDDVSGSTAAVLFSASTMGAVMLAFRIFDGVTDPISGAISDNWVRRGKARRTLLWYSFAIPAIGLLLCFAPTHEMTQSLRWTLVTSGLFIFFVGYTLYCIPYWSLILDYSQGNEKTQRSMSNLLGVGVLIATAIGFVVTPLLVSNLGYFQGAGLIAAVGTLLMTLPINAYPEPLEQPTNRTGNETPPPLIESVLIALKDRKFTALLILLSGAHMSLTVMTSAAPFIAVHLLGGTDQDVALLLGPFLGVGLLCLSVTTRLSKRWGWEKCLLIACASLGLVYASTSGLDTPIFGTPMFAATCIFMCGGPMVAVILGVEGEAITDCAIARSAEHVSMYWGVYNFVVKAMNGVAIWVCGILAARILIADDSLLTGLSAVRAMSIVAGVFLVMGVVLYLFARRTPTSLTDES